MEIMRNLSENLVYLSPVAEILELYTEGVLCTSGDSDEPTEPLDEILGQW